MEKLIFNLDKPRKKHRDNRTTIKIYDEVYDIAKEICVKTGLSMTAVASKMIEFAAENIEFVCGESEE